MTCQIYTMPARRLAAIPKGVEHTHEGAPVRGMPAPSRSDPPHWGVECIHQKWGLF